MNSDRFNTIQTGSTGEVSDDGRMIATSATRNADAIISAMSNHVPNKGRALEIASGSGQHIARFAQEFPNLIWQPSDVDPVKINSIDSWVQHIDLDNLLEPILLDATVFGWGADHSQFDLVILVNLLHLISMAETENLIAETSDALTKNGVMLIYGPFRRGQHFASDGDEQFHHSLSAQDPSIGYKSFENIQHLQTNAGLHINIPHELPANNLMLVATKQ